MWKQNWFLSHTNLHYKAHCQRLSYSTCASSCPCSVSGEWERRGRLAEPRARGVDPREALGRRVGAAFSRSWFHLWVLIWEGPAHGSCVRWPWWEWLQELVSSEESPWRGLILYIIREADATHECWLESTGSLITFCLDAVSVCGLNLAVAACLSEWTVKSSDKTWKNSPFFFSRKQLWVSFRYQMVELKITTTLLKIQPKGYAGNSDII